MNYDFETLGDERFQQLAQSLLTISFPNVQCLPVGQPDGGRDAFIFRTLGRRTELIAFQVKYSKVPGAKAERDAIAELIKTEKTKIGSLKKRGLKAYYLISNVSGTSHLDVGSIDITNKELSDAFDIPSYCWWRDDLIARINANSDIKWSFPDLMKGTDVLQFLVEGRWNELDLQRQAAVRSYIASQYDNDKNIKFKQVDLQSGILDLFVDLPMNPPQSGFFNEFKLARYRHLRSTESPEIVYYDEVVEGDRPRLRSLRRRHYSDAAETLLSNHFEMNMRRLVIEGAPGQGKSTITQYVCQVNRIKLLAKRTDLIRLSSSHAKAPVRLPFRIDLRDFATWVGGRNPFVASSADSLAPNPSLESFIAAQVFSLSGGQEFSAGDFVSIVKAGNVLVVLDGFDEVADIPTRKRVVDEISKAANRLEAHSNAAQIIVTSRPAAFANSPGFSKDNWSHWELQSLTLEQTTSYTKKWMKAKFLPQKEQTEFLSLLGEKLSQPHMRDLARNPMQLTILLALVLTRGLSLPDKRTALYDSYIELFFNRESEKSRVVRDHRDLLIDMHRYLAWELHKTAESGPGSGSISESDLKKSLSHYLLSEGHDDKLVDELFTGITERVVALVSRVQGTFEFEVQPLREYFAARHLYETAPYSPTGSEKRGTKTEIFDAMARNFYWLNVARFYCGCYSKGELASLVDGLDSLCNSVGYKLLAHPVILAIMLLGDWVFSQQPQAVDRVIQNIFTGQRLWIYSAVSNAECSLPEKCGREQLAEYAYERVKSTVEANELLFLYKLIRSNTDQLDRFLKWKSQRPVCEADFANWINVGRRLDVLSKLNDGEKLELFASSPAAVVEEFTRSIPPVEFDDANAYKMALDYLLDGTVTLTLYRRKLLVDESLELVAQFFSPFVLRQLLSDQSTVPAYAIMPPRSMKLESSDEENGQTSLRKKVKSFAGMLQKELIKPCKNWSTNLASWHRLLNKAGKEFGPRWLLQSAFVAAALAVDEKTDINWSAGCWSELDNFGERVLFAKQKRNNQRWWKERLADLADGAAIEDQQVALLVILSYGSGRVLRALSKELSRALEALDDATWTRLYKGLKQIHFIVSGPEFGALSSLPPVESSNRYKLAFALRSKHPFKEKLLKEDTNLSLSKDRWAEAFIVETAVSCAINNTMQWRDTIDMIRSRKSAIANYGELENDKIELPFDLAEEICTYASEYPPELIKLAHTQIASTVGSSAPKLADVAKLDGWFSK